MSKNYLKSVEEINEILKKGSLALINEFEDKFIDLENIRESSSRIVLENRMLVRNAYILTIVKYRSNADIYKFKELIKGDKNSKNIINLIAKDCRCGGELGKVIDNSLDYFFGDYLSIIDNFSFKSCLNTRFVVDKLIDAINIKDGIYSTEYLMKEPEKKLEGKYDYLINPDTFF